MKLLLKNTFKKIKNSFGRFLSIMLIIALGISVFIGLREATAGMLYTADNYYDISNLMDFKITSTYGLTTDDVQSLIELEHTIKVVPSYSIDVISSGESIRIHALENDINNVILANGRMPDNNNECVADYYNYKIGETITFEGDNLNDFLSINECNVVGLIKSTLYVRDEKGISTVGNGKLISFVFINKENFLFEYYTEIYLTANDSQSKNSYYEDYDKQIAFLKNELEQLKPIRETVRYEEILKEASEKITEIKKQLDKKTNDAISELKQVKLDLDNAKLELELNKTNNYQLFDKNKKELTDKKELLLVQLNTLDIKELQLDAYLSNLLSEINNLKDQLSKMINDSDEYNHLNLTINELEANYSNLNTINNNLININNNLIILEENYENFKRKILKQEEKLQKGYNDYEEGLNKLEQEKTNANQEIKKAKEDLEKVEKPIWYLLDRTDNSGYISYKEDIIKVESISKILPIFFIIVVVLMILNTLTRLIEEERTEIGILQSNGFSKSSIIFSYLFYVCTSGLLGISIGLTIGYSLIPKIIYSVFLARYYAPKLITIVSPLPFSLVIIVTLIIMIGVTIVACHKELKETPAFLLRPKPPKTGKRVILERVTVLWEKLNFTWKTTIRNLFRYKKRVIMTVTGIAGCTALLVTGLGLNDSINTISKLQYNDIIKYDAMYILKENVTRIPNDLEQIYTENGVVNPMLINQMAFTFSFDNKTEDVYVVVPSDSLVFNNYVTLTSVINDKKISINDNGVIITKQMADHLKANVGDIISIRNSNNELFFVNISDITYNYVSHYIYMSQHYYQEIFGNITYNSVIANGRLNENIKLTKYNVLMVNYTEDILKTFDNFVSGLNKIIIMIVIFACFLAFIVLYNLTIINVSERKREIATFKVLGFYEKEISSLVYRETLILTIIGALLGLFLGVYLHQFIISTAETNNILFLRKINYSSFALSFLITIIFSIFIQLIINRTLKKIDMIDSLKLTE